MQEAPHLHLAWLLLLLFVPSDRNCREVLDDTLGVHRLSRPGLSAVGSEANKIKECKGRLWLPSHRGANSGYSRDEDGLIVPIWRGRGEKTK